MLKNMTESQLAESKRWLEKRFRELREAVRQELLQADNEHYRELAGAVADTGDESTADLLADVNLAVISNHINEIRAVEAALIQIARGTYGICVDCEGEIESARLHAYPVATRCRDCQEHFESSYFQPRHDTL